jgi:esterase/lipase superfamily enzyme
MMNLPPLPVEIRAIPTLESFQTTESGDYRTVTVFYATNRIWNGDRTARAAFYGRDPLPEKEVAYGTCQVSIPRTHMPGERETPFIASIPFVSRWAHWFEDPKKHIVLLDVGRLGVNDYFRHVTQRIGASPEKSAFVFVHGFNVSFKDACRQTAQVAWDIGFTGAPLLFSWPSDGATANYVADQEEMSDAVDQLEAFLWRVAKQTGARRVHLIAHSLGSRGLVAALKRMSETRNNPGQVFDQIVMAAADIRVHSFQQERAALAKLAKGTTLYISDNDRALLLSHTLHPKHPRVGEVGNPIVLYSGIDTIDASPVSFSLLGINHSYWSDKIQVLSDLAELFVRKPHPRKNLQERKIAAGVYWTVGKPAPVR